MQRSQLKTLLCPADSGRLSLLELLKKGPVTISGPAFSERPSGLIRAIIEVGRMNKTLYLLNYIDDEDYRRRILTQLNRGERRHAVARAICHGQKGEIRKRYTDGQEDQLGALGLVTNAVVLWNTIYMQAALDPQLK
jgi:TnpA family transposase